MVEKKPATAKKPAEAKMVKVRCIVETHPWTDEKSLNLGEVAHVPEKLAGTMLQNKQVERVR